jgi:outer membrane protein OmpA-like peptidoglycan-associated protein
MNHGKEHFMKTIQLLMIVTVAALFAGCATAPPKELVGARAAYLTASQGDAARLVPAELHKAHQALTRAEHSFNKDPDSYRTRDLSYVAMRKAELASALGTMATDKASVARADADYKEEQSAIVEQGKQDLKDSEQRAADEAVAAASDKADADLEASEARTADALAQLAKLAAVKEEDRGLVVTLSGSVLFRSSESILLPSAQAKLDQVGTALMAVKERNLIVEGHTDSQGSGAYNQDLSQRRAEAVRDYLVQKGYPSDRIQARGRGMDSPIGNNASPEGRANNRRVEIIIERAPQASNK